MKKVLYSLLIFVSILFVSYEVSADTYDDTNTVYIDSKHSNFTSVYEELKPKLEEINSILSNNPLNHKYVVFFGKNSNGNFINVYLMAHNANYNLTDMFCFTTAVQGANVNTGKLYYSYYSGCNSNPSQSPYNFARYEYKSSDSSSYNTLITNLSNDILLEWTSSKFKGRRSAGSALITTSMLNFSFTNNLYDYFNNNTYFALPYSSNVNIYNRLYYSSSNTIYKLQFDKTEILPNSYLEPSDNYFKEEEPEPNIFEQQIDDIEYSKMIFEFDINSLVDRDYVLDFLYDFSTIGNLDLNGELYDEVGTGFPEPYLEIINSTGFKDIISLESLNESHNVLKIAWAGTYQETINSDLVSLKLVIPMNVTDNVRYDIGLISYIPYTYSFEYDEELESYYAEIDLSNKYGVMFIPKLLENNSSITSTFIFGGIEKILIYDTYDYKQTPIKTFSGEDGAISYQFDRYDLNYNLFFVSEQKPLRSLVKYDTRYFDYQIVDTKYSIATIINPNTGQMHYIDYSNIFNLSSNFSSMSEIFDFISEQLDEESNAYVLFQNSVNVFFNTMPAEVYVMILTLFSIILLGVTLGLGGWK